MGDERTQSCFRKLVEYLPYLHVWWNSTLEKIEKKPCSGLAKLKAPFLIVAGGDDGCSFEKNGFFLSFMNVGEWVASDNDNFIVFGGNCKETSLVRKFREFVFIEKKIGPSNALSYLMTWKCWPC